MAPKFCKAYASVGIQIEEALQKYHEEVKSSVFPSDEFSPYSMSAKQQEEFQNLAKKMFDEEEHQGGYIGSPGDKGDQVFEAQVERERITSETKDETIQVY